MSEESIYQKVIDDFKITDSVKKTAENVGTTLVRTQRILLTEGLWSSETSEKIGDLYKKGYSVMEIATKLFVSEKTVQAYLPYTRTKLGYGNEMSSDAVKSSDYRQRMTDAANRQVSAETAKDDIAEMQSMKDKLLPDEKGYPSESITIILDEEMKAVREQLDEQVNKDAEYEEKITVSELYHNIMRAEPEAFRLSLELDTSGLNAKEFDLLRKYGRVQKGITRDVIVPADITLHALNYAILRAFGWQNGHLHQFVLPAEVFQKLTGGKDNPDSFGYVKHDGNLDDWIDLCGIYFRYPTEDFEDIYWDDDYREGESFRSWLRKKYTGPYTYKGNWEHYYKAHNAAESLKEKMSGNESIEDIEMGFCGCMDELLERLQLKEILVPQGAGLNEDIWEKVKSLTKEQKTNMENARVFPVTDELLYAYDYGDGWKVKIKITDCYYTKDYLDTVIEGNMLGYVVAVLDTKKALKDEKAYDMHNNRLDDELAYQIANVIFKKRPVCVEADGLAVLDDVGGIHGYVDFLKTIREGDAEDREFTKMWAKGMGWTGYMYKPENIL